MGALVIRAPLAPDFWKLPYQHGEQGPQLYPSESGPSKPHQVILGSIRLSIDVYVHVYNNVHAYIYMCIGNMYICMYVYINM